MTFSMTKLSVFSASICLLAMPTLASGQSAASLSGLYACETIASPDEQLTCFKRETAKLRALTTGGDAVVMEKKTLTPAPIGSSPSVTSEARAIVPEAPVLEATVPNTEAKPKKEKTENAKRGDKQSLVIKKAERYGSKRYVRFTTENGDVWEQTQPGRVRLERGQTNSLTLKKASFGSYLARINGTGSSFRVRKVN